MSNFLPAIVKQVVSGDTVKIRNKPTNKPPVEKVLIIKDVSAPKLGFRKKDDNQKDEPYAWESREYLRKKLIGQEVFVNTQQQFNENPDRIYGTIYFPKDNNITEELVANGLVSVRSTNVKQPSAELQKLMELEKEAKTKGIGKWSSNSKGGLRNVIFIDNPEMMVKTLKGKRINGIVEVVNSGSTIQVLLLPEFYNITLLISGVRCDSPNDGDGIGSEAKFFVESRLLQQDVEVVIESFKGNSFIGSVFHPKGDIAEYLLKEGFATCVDSTMVNVTNGSDKLRSAEKYAKENRLRRWKDWEPSSTKIPNREFQGIVHEIILGDGMIIKFPNGDTKKIFLSSIRSPRLPDSSKKENEDPNETKPQSGPRGGRIFDVPLLFEAREFLRKHLIGKKVHVTIDYIQQGRETLPERSCCTVTIGGINIAESLVAEGLADVVTHRQDDENRSSFYDALLSAKQKAVENNRGIHSKQPPSKIRINDLTSDPARVKGLIPIFQRVSRLDAIVEYVAGGARMRLFIPRDSVIIVFLLSGISCPRTEVLLRNNHRQPAERYGNEALKFTRDKVIQRNVEIKIESCDKGGNMIGWLFINGVNLSVALVEEGLARVHNASAGRSEYYRQLIQAEESAKSRKLNIWQHDVEEVKDQVVDDVATREVNRKNARIEVITPELHVFAQYVDDEKQLLYLTEQLQEQMSSYVHSSDYRPRRGELCAAKYSDGQWYRGKVQKPGNRAQILYIDYGNAAEVDIKNLAPLPAGLNASKPFAHEYGLACVKLPPSDDIDEVILSFHKQITERVLAINVEYYENNVPYITIVDPETEEDEIKKAIAAGYFRVADRKEKKLQSLLEEYKSAQAEAKDKRLFIWQYGDITEDDAKEFGYSK